jgi:RNA polymerase sigma-70 factor, ECF subfamily
MQNESDEELMVRFQQTLDNAPFHEIVNRHYSLAVYVAKGRLGSADLAQDAVQETLIRIVRERHRFDGKRPFASWFYTVLKNICTDIQRKEIRYRQKLEDYAADATSTASHGCTNELPEALNFLADSEREILVFRLVNGFSFREIAHHYGCTEDAAKKRAQRALQRLRQMAGKRS